MIYIYIYTNTQLVLVPFAVQPDAPDAHPLVTPSFVMRVFQKNKSQDSSVLFRLAWPKYPRPSNTILLLSSVQRPASYIAQQIRVDSQVAASLGIFMFFGTSS